jgi:hypothetical protein
MTAQPVSVLGAVVAGLLVAGPLAALAHVAAPEAGRGPWIPMVVGVLSVAIAVGLRLRRGRTRTAPHAAGDGNREG